MSSQATLVSALPVKYQNIYPHFAEEVAEYEGYDKLLNIVDSETGFVTLKDTKFQVQFIDKDSIFQNYVKLRYLQWVREDCYMLLRNETQNTTYAIKACKRGNDKYHKRVKERFGALMELPDIQFFKPEEVDEVHDTKLLFISTTYAHSKCSQCGSPLPEKAQKCRCGGDSAPVSLREAWSKATSDYNKYATWLRDNYGEVSLVRVIEAQQNGYPHIHIIALFHDSEFTAFKHDNIWRIAEKDEVSEYWSSGEYLGNGFVDIEAGYSLRGMLSYVVKYLNKMHDMDRVGLPEPENEAHSSQLGELVSKASLTTLSMLWVHGIRSFAISRDWVDATSDLIEAKHNSRRVETVFEVNEVGEVEISLAEPDKWVLLGFFHGGLRRGSRGVWSTELSGAEVRLIQGRSGWVSHQAIDWNKDYTKDWCELECDMVPSRVFRGAM